MELPQKGHDKHKQKQNMGSLFIRIPLVPRLPFPNFDSGNPRDVVGGTRSLFEHLLGAFLWQLQLRYRDLKPENVMPGSYLPSPEVQG